MWPSKTAWLWQSGGASTTLRTTCRLTWELEGSLEGGHTLFWSKGHCCPHPTWQLPTVLFSPCLCFSKPVFLGFSAARTISIKLFNLGLQWHCSLLPVLLPTALLPCCPSFSPCTRPTLAWPYHSLFHSLWTGLSKSSLSFLIHLITSRSEVLNMSILKISNSPHRPQVPSQIPGLKSDAVHVPPALCMPSSLHLAFLQTQTHTVPLQSLLLPFFPLSSLFYLNQCSFLSHSHLHPKFCLSFKIQLKGTHLLMLPLSVPHCPSQAEVMQ